MLFIYPNCVQVVNERNGLMLKGGLFHSRNGWIDKIIGGNAWESNRGESEVIRR